MIEFSSLWMLWWFDISCKALLLGTVAYVAILLFRLRDPNITHRVWTSTMVGMCCLPILVLVTPRVPLPNWLQVSQVALSAEQSTRSDVVAREDSRIDSFRAISSMTDNVGAELLVPRAEPLYEASQNSEAGTIEADIGQVVSAGAGLSPLNKPISRIATFKSTLASLAVAAMFGQVAISVFFLIRLFTGLLVSKRMIDRATPIVATAYGLPESIRLLQSKRNQRTGYYRISEAANSDAM